MTNEELDNKPDNNFLQVKRSSAQDSTQFQTKACKELFEWCDSFKPNFPTRSQFDIIDHSDKAANIFLIEVLDDGQYEYRLNGEEVIYIVGNNSAGIIFSTESADGDLSRFAMYLDELLDKRTPIHSYGTLDSLGKSYLNFESFDFPLVDDSGKITHILGLVILVDEPET